MQHNRNYTSFCCDLCEHNNHNLEKYEIIEDNYLNMC